MLQLTYISTATPGVDDTDVEKLLKTSRRNNAAVGVTGLLLYNGKRFLQVIEGDALRVNEIYRRITAGPRHRALVKLSSVEITERAFGSWAMAAQRVHGDTASADLSLQIEALTNDVTDPNIKANFRSFAALRPAA